MTCNAPALNRVFLELGPITIYWYGLIIATGLFLGLFIATREAERLKFKKELIVDLVMFAAPIAIVFARIYYVIFEWDQYKGGSWWKIIAVWEGGIAIHGALIGAVLTAIVFARFKKVSFWQLADIVAPSLILGQAIGRWGNFMNQEAHGGPISESAFNSFHQYLPDFIMNQMCINGIYYHPTFLYESIWNIAVLIFLLVLRKYNPLRGELFLTYIATYSVGRFFIEALRTDSLYFGFLKQAQLISVAMIVGAVILIIYRRKFHIAKLHYDGKKRKNKRSK